MPRYIVRGSGSLEYTLDVEIVATDEEDAYESARSEFFDLAECDDMNIEFITVDLVEDDDE